MKRILFVDDEARILDGLRASLQRQRGEWDMVFSAHPEDALRELRANPFDVVVSDMRMPGMDGAALLAAVRDESPATIRILLSGHGDRDAIARALSVCHQFLAKPCEAATLKGTIERISGLQRMLGDERLRSVVGKLVDLPSMPRIYAELCAALRSRNSSARELGRIIGSDPGIAAKLLKIANSSFFGITQRVTVPERAIAYLGIDLVRSLVLGAEVFTSVSAPGLDLEDAQAHALITSMVARHLVRAPLDQDDAATAGLLHDVGELVLAGPYPEVTEARANLSGRERLEAERGALGGVTHAEVGAYLVGIWGLPLGIVEAVAFHEEPERCARMTDPTAAVHVAAALVDDAMARRRGAAPPNMADPACLARFGDPATLAGEADAFVARWFDGERTA
jgi:HD-like signal output (HDOD) protein